MYKRFLAWSVVCVVVVVGIIFAVPGSRYMAVGYLRREPMVEYYPAGYYTHALESAEPERRKNAAFRLGMLGPDGGPVAPALAKALGDEDDLVRINAALALFKIGRPGMAAVPALAVALHDRLSLVRMDAALALTRIGPDARAAVPELVASLGRPENRGRMPNFPRSPGEQMVLALGAIGPAAHDAVPALRAALGDNEIGMRWAAARALRRIDPQSLEGVAVEPDEPDTGL
jgi:hypothetical protein